MSEHTNPFIGTRKTVELEAANGQARNRLWWEAKPMTYADWDAAMRIPKTDAALQQIQRTILAASPFLRERFNFSQTEGLAVLDVGCGSGALSGLLANAGGDVTSIDLTQAAVELAERNAALNRTRFEVVRGDAENLPFAARHYDYVFSWGALHHSENFERALAEVARVLKDRGRGLIMVYHRNSIAYYLLGLYWLFAKGKLLSGYTIHNVQDFYTDGYYHRYFSVGELTECLNRAGLALHRATITQYQKRILPGIPASLDRHLKSRFGMCAVVEFEKKAELLATTTHQIVNRRSRLELILWFWICGVLVAYLYQFRGLLGALSSKLGLN